MLDDRVEVVERDLEALEDVGPVARLAQVELGSPTHDLAPPVDVVLEHGLEGQGLGLAVDEGQHVHVEGELEGRVLEEVVEHLVWVGVALALDDDAHAVAIGLVAQVGDAVDLLAGHEVGDLLDEGRLVDLVGQLGDHDRDAVLARLLEGTLRLHHDPSAPVGVHLADGVDLLPLAGQRIAPLLVAEDRAAGREVRPEHEGAQLVAGQARIVDQRDRRVGDLA